MPDFPSPAPADGPAFYNEIDPYAAQWLRNLIAAGHIAPGVVDTRSIEDIRPSELAGYTQCHFFAGIGVWSLALRRAGWPDDRPVWTGSCPCQPFSQAGKGDGFADERHLWPDFHWLIGERRPPVVLGEQVASSDANPWIDLVQADMEGLGFAFGAVAFPAAGIGAPHIRDRLYWVARANGDGRRQGGLPPARRAQAAVGPQADQPGHAGASGGVADAIMQQRQGGEPGVSAQHDTGGRVEGAAAVTGFRCDSGLADATGGQHITSGAWADQRAMAGSDGAMQAASGPTGPTNGYWADADWLFCRDGRWRPVEPGTFPLAHGAPSRVGRLRAYGNAIVAESAITFIESVMTC